MEAEVVELQLVESRSLWKPTRLWTLACGTMPVWNYSCGTPACGTPSVSGDPSLWNPLVCGTWLAELGLWNHACGT